MFYALSLWPLSASDRIKSKLVPHLRSQVAWERLLIARNDPNGRPHDGYSSLELLEALEHVTFVNSELAHNCYVTCHKMGLMCSKRWAFAINTCDIMKVQSTHLLCLMDNWCWMVTSSLQAAYPQSSTCTTTFYGRDLPAYRQVSRIVSPSPFLFFLVYISTLICVQNDAHILLNDRIVAWTPSCGASHDLTQRQGAYRIWTHLLIFVHLFKSCAGLVAAILSHRGHPTQRFTLSWTARFSCAQSTFWRIFIDNKRNFFSGHEVFWIPVPIQLLLVPAGQNAWAVHAAIERDRPGPFDEGIGCYDAVDTILLLILLARLRCRPSSCHHFSSLPILLCYEGSSDSCCPSPWYEQGDLATVWMLKIFF